jgi:hypothetical protein
MKKKVMNEIFINCVRTKSYGKKYRLDIIMSKNAEEIKALSFYLLPTENLEILKDNRRKIPRTVQRTAPTVVDYLLKTWTWF